MPDDVSRGVILPLQFYAIVKMKRPSLWLTLLTCVSLASTIRKCTPEDQKRDLEPGQCVSHCAGKDGTATCQGNPTVKEDNCDYLTVVRDSDGSVVDKCCSKTPSESSKNRPRCGREHDWLECDPDNGFGSCCSPRGYET